MQNACHISTTIVFETLLEKNKVIDCEEVFNFVLLA